MSKSSTTPAPVLLLIVGLVSACSFGPPPSCGDEIGGTADTQVFDQNFNSMELVSQSTGQPGTPSDSGAAFPSADSLRILVDSKAELDLRTCIQPLSGQADSPIDTTSSLEPGQGTLDLGTFESGSYVIRVIVDGVLVRNFPFHIE